MDLEQELQELKAEYVKNILSLPDVNEKGYPNILKLEFKKRAKRKGTLGSSVMINFPKDENY